MARQIAAVDGGHVDGVERPEVPGVVPVEEVARVALQLRQLADKFQYEEILALLDTGRE